MKGKVFIILVFCLVLCGCSRLENFVFGGVERKGQTFDAQGALGGFFPPSEDDVLLAYSMNEAAREQQKRIEAASEPSIQ